MFTDFRKCIAKLLDCNVFEIQLHTDENKQTNCYIPYMMNDALECYFVLKNCRVTGEFGNFACDKVRDVEFVNDDIHTALVLRQPNGNVSTLWFEDIAKVLKCYRYHEIGHFWVAGQEQWRQLVYMIGTIYDKFSYMGESLCNEEELALLPLMEFAPFRYWSPIHESLDDHYPDTLSGFACFKELCKEAGDSLLLRLTERYEKVTCGGFGITDFYRKLALPGIIKKLALELNRSGHETLYELIYQKVCEASSQYPARDYGDSLSTKIMEARHSVSEALTAKGYVGEYPRFSLGNRSLLVTEEHPFTLAALEYENYEFRIQFMVSETLSPSRYLNQGFFEDAKGKNRGWIAKSVNKL